MLFEVKKFILRGFSAYLCSIGTAVLQRRRVPQNRIGSRAVSRRARVGQARRLSIQPVIRPWAERASGEFVGPRTALLLASSKRGLYSTADWNLGPSPGKMTRPSGPYEIIEVTHTWPRDVQRPWGVTIPHPNGRVKLRQNAGLDGVILIKAGRDRNEVVSTRAMLPRDLAGPIPQCAACINALGVSLLRPILPIDYEPSARNLSFSDLNVHTANPL